MADPISIPAGEALAQALLVSSDDRIERIDLMGRVLWSNRPAGGGAGDRWVDRWEEPERRRAARAVTLAAAGGAQAFEAWRLEPDASPRCWSVTLRLIPADAGRPAELLATSRDVTRRAAQAAILSVGGERQPAGAPEVAVLAFDVDGNVRGWDAGAHALFGYAREEIVGRSGDVLWTPEDRDAGAPGRERGIAAARGVAPDRRWHVRKDGARVFVDGAMIARIDEAGRPAGYVKVCRDDTARQATREELAEARRRLDSALIAGELGTFQWDLVTDRLRADTNFQRIFGVPIPPGEMLPIGVFLDVLHPDDLDETVARIRATIERDDRYETEYRVRHADGAERWVIARGGVERDPAGKATQFHGVILDITDRKRAEAERRRIADEQARQSRVYETILSTTDDFAFIFDLEGRVEYANRRLLEVWGLTLEQAVGLTLVEVGYPIWHAAMHRREIDEVIATKRSVRGELPFTGASGQGGVYDYVFSPVIGPDGQVERVVGTTRDVTERRRAEDARRVADARAQFLAELADATRNLADPADVVAAVSQRLGEYLGVSRCAHADVAADGDAFTINADYCNLGVASCAGTYRLDLFGPRAAADMRGGRTLVVRDVDAEVDAAGAATFLAIDCRAIVCCPLIRGGRLVAMMAVHQATPRDWTAADVSLVEAVVERTWGYLERARDLRAIAESEARFRQLADAMPQIVWASTPAGVIDYYNRRWYEYTGLPDDGGIGDGSWEPVLLDEELPAIHAAWRASLASGELYEMRYRVRRASDGSYRWHLARALPVRDAAGTIVRWYGTNTDIHDQKLAEAALADSEARFRQLADAMPQIVFAATPDGHVDYFNRQWFEYTGLPRDGVGDGVKHWQPVHTAEGLARALEAWSHSIATGQTYEVEYQLRRADGHFRWHLGRALPVRDDAGRIVRWYGTNTDIHDWKIAEGALAADKAALEQIAAGRPLGDVLATIARGVEAQSEADVLCSVLLIDDDGRRLRHGAAPSLPDDYNRAIDGIEIGPNVGSCGAAAYHRRAVESPDFATDPNWQPFAALTAAAGLAASRSVPIFAPDGALLGTIAAYYRHPRESSPRDRELIDAACRLAAVAIERDRGERRLRATAEALARQGRFLDAALSAVSDFAYTFDRDGRFLFASPPLLELWGITLDEAVGKNFFDLGYPPELAARLQRQIRDVYKTRQTLGGSTEYVSPTGVAGSYDYTFTPVLAPDGSVEVVAGATRVTTERVRLERERERLLESERAARAESERAGRMKDEFLATLSHELRTPLSAMLGWSQMLRRDGARPETVRQGLETIERNARAQTQIIDDLLDMSRIISGKVSIEPRPIDLAEAVRGAVESVRPTAQGKGVALSLDVAADAAAALADPGRLQQVLWNLLSNAIKFTPRGGRVEVALDRDGPQWRLRVADTGEGIAPDFLPHVFDRFRQADASTTRRHGGLGLGLAIVKQIVELHGGAVAVESAGPGLGATFIVRLPVPAADEASDRAPRVAAVRVDAPEPSAADGAPILRPVRGAPTWDDRAALQLAGRRVLVVDDEADARALLRHLLESCGATVVDAADAEAGVAAVRATLTDDRRFDVIVSDVGMPRENGYAMLARVRALGGAASNLPAIALTAYARAEDRVAALRAGFQMHVPKPVEPAELVTTIATLTARATV